MQSLCRFRFADFDLNLAKQTSLYSTIHAAGSQMSCRRRLYDEASPSIRIQSERDCEQPPSS